MKTSTFEIGFSDHHKLICTTPRSAFVKGKPNKFFYRWYKNFEHEKFEEELKRELPLVPYFEFTLKIDRSNNEAVTSKFIPKAIMKIFRWKNNFNNEKNFENWSEYKSQRSYCINLPKQSKPDPLFNLAFQDSFIFNRELWVLLFFLKRLRYTENLYSI